MVRRTLKRFTHVAWGRALRDTARAAHKHDCTDAAAAMAFDFVFAVFPGILVLTALLSLLDISPADFEMLLQDLGIVIPAPLLVIVEENIQHLWKSSQSLFFVGILGVVWPASASMSTTMSALNRAYQVSEERSFWVRRWLSVLLVVGVGFALVFLFNLSVFSEHAENWLRVHLSLSKDFPSLVGLLRQIAGIAGAIIVAACIYRVIPSIRLSWLDVLPGSMLFFLLWSLIAAGFRFYVKGFGYYKAVYGVLGLIIVILLSAYLVAFVLLLGGELNAAIHRLREEQESQPVSAI